MKRLEAIFTDRYAPLFLLLITILGFGLLLPWLGFYWDDWAKISVARLGRLGDYARYYAEDRPLSAWTHILFTPLLGTTPLPWHIFTLLLRWLSAWGAWWCLNQIWPPARRQNLAAAVLFLLHPVFISQPAAVTFHQQWLQFALFFLSFGLMLSAQRRTGRAAILLHAAALAAMLAQLSVTEYFAPLELLRPLGLYFLFRQQQSARASARRALRAWAPYLLVTALYVAWRLFFLKLPGADPYRAETLYAFLQSPLATLARVARVALVDELEILVNAWGRLLQAPLNGLTLMDWAGAAAGLLAVAGVTLFLARYHAAGAQEVADGTAEARWLRQALIFGVAAVLLGPVPAWITGRQVVFDFHSDRYALPATFGAGLLLAVLVYWLSQKRLQRALLVGVLAGCALAFQFGVANDYRWEWTRQQRFFWELAWRAPGLQAPTALIMESEPFPNQGLFSTSAALNLMYPQHAGLAGRLSYWVYALRPRFPQPPDSSALSFNTTFRSLHFEGQTPQSLLLYQNPQHGNCLWVLSARDAAHPYLSELVKAFLPASDLSRIEPVAAAGYPPADILGAEPVRGWCSLFEQADLARQLGDWPAVVTLADEALAQGHAPEHAGSNSPYEWLPMIEGLARVGRIDEASTLTGRAYATDPAYRGMLCDLWETVPGGAAPEELRCAELR